MQQQLENFKAKLSPIVASILRTALRLLDVALGTLINDPIRLEQYRAAIQLPVGIVDVLSDNDPEDGDQLVGLLNELILKGDLQRLIRDAVYKQIGRLPANLRPIPEVMYDQSIQIADLLTDDDDANKAQIGAYLQALPRDGDANKLLDAVVGLWVDDPLSRAQLTLVILETIAALIPKTDARRPTLESNIIASRLEAGDDSLSPIVWKNLRK